MTYQALDQSTVINYLRGVDSLDGVLDRDADLRAREVGDGNLNLIEQELDKAYPEIDWRVSKASANLATTR
ncbi:MAG: hypothetical protein R2851_08030 [Caldilineaceae bacterium]